MNAEILTIAVGDFTSPSAKARAESYPFPVLYDENGEVAEAYDVLRSGFPEAIPSVFIVDANGSIVWQSKGSTYHRTPNSDIIAQLEKLS